MLEIPRLDFITHGDKTIVVCHCTKEYFYEVINPNDGKEISIHEKTFKQVTSEWSGRSGICYNPTPYRLASIEIDAIN